MKSLFISLGMVIAFGLGAAVYPRVNPAPSVPLPTHVLCGGANYTIAYEPMELVYGLTNAGKLYIHIDPGYALAFEQQVLMHELMHCAHETTTRTAQIAEGAKNINAVGETADEWIESTAPGIEQVLRDNPEVVRYLTQR